MEKDFEYKIIGIDDNGKPILDNKNVPLADSGSACNVEIKNVNEMIRATLRRSKIRDNFDFTTIQGPFKKFISEIGGGYN